MSRDLAIDLGTANTLVYAKGKGLVLNEPTVVALDSRSREVLAIGTDAWQMIGRTPGYIVAERPLRGGAITDFEVTERMLSVLLHRVGVGRLNRPKVLICVPSAITAVERRAVKEAARRAGASASFLIEQPMAAAIGAGLPIHEPVGNMVVDVGGGTAEMAVISLGGVVAVQALRCGGFDFDASIQNYVRHRYGVAVGERTAEAVKLAIGSASPHEGEQQAEIRGREVATGMPMTVVLSPLEIRGALEDNVASIIAAAAECLGEAPPELAQDIMFQGVHLTGGGALLRGMTQRLADATHVPVHLVDTPLECVVQGAGVCLESFDRLKRLFTDDGRRRVRQTVGSSSNSPAAWRTCQSRSSLAARSAGVTRGSSKPASATVARRRTVGASVQRVEHGRQSGGVADGTERGHRGLAAAGVGVPGRGRRQVRHRGPCVPLGQEPGRADNDERIGIGQRARHGAGQRRAGAAAAGGQRHLDGAPPQRRFSVGERGLHVGGLQLAQAGQCTERRRLHARIGIGEATAGQGGVPAVPGHGDAAAPDFGAAVTALIRGNIVAHLPSMSEPDATADGEAAANPTPSDARPDAGGVADAFGAPQASACRRRRSSCPHGAACGRSCWPASPSSSSWRRWSPPARRSTTTSSRRGTPRRSRSTSMSRRRTIIRSRARSC